MMDEEELAELASSRTLRGVHSARPGPSSPDSPRATQRRRSSLAPRQSSRSDRAPPPVFAAAPQATLSVLELVTALPLLLSLDRTTYTATLNSAQPRVLESVYTTPTANNGVGSGYSVALRGRPVAAPTDATSAAVRAVLYTRGTPSWQAKRRRLRRVALDAFFRASLSARIADRCEHSAAGGDGVREATDRLLRHTQRVLAQLSPTQMHLLDLFVAPLRRGAPPSHPSVTEASAEPVPPPPSREPGPVVAPASAAPPPARPGADGAPPGPARRGIMKGDGSASTSSTASPRHRRSEEGAARDGTSATIAEQLLYIILRTSIAANTPAQDEDVDDGAPTWVSRDNQRTPPSQRAAGATAQSSSPASAASSSALASLTRKKPRLDNVGVEEAAAAGLPDSEQSIQHYLHHTAGGAHRGGAAAVTVTLPYEPRCWLAPSTVALVERSVALRRQQRWTCDLDPVIEATVAGDGLYTSRAGPAPVGAGARSAAVRSLLGGIRSSWVPLPGVDDGEDAAALAALARGSGLPFEGRGAASIAGASSHPWQWATAAAPAAGDEGDPAVTALFSSHVASRGGSVPRDGAGACGSEPAVTGEEARQPQRRSDAARLPECRLPFVSLQPLFDVVVYAQVHLALHRCTAGLADPFDLTVCDTTAGRDMPMLRVREEFYMRVLHTHAGGVGGAAAATPISGLASLLEWGCHYGTLLRRLHRLCDAADNTAVRGGLGSYGRCAMSTLRLLLCLLQRQMGELGDQAGGPHRLSFVALLSAQQRLQRAVEQVEVLAEFFAVPGAGPTPVTWDPVSVLQERCSSASLLSRLYECFSARHANALGQHSDVASHYHALRQEQLAALLSSMDTGGAGGAPPSMGAWGHGGDRRRRLGQQLCAASATATAPALGTGEEEEEEARELWEQQRKELHSHSLDVMGLLLRATLRPLNTMLHRWLTAGELADPYDEFFVVPSHGQTHSGFALEPSPQRLPVFLSVAAATDLLHAGVSLRVLRAAATHVTRSARKDARRLQGVAELREAAAEDYAEELVETQTLQRAIELFIERLVHGAPAPDAAQRTAGHETASGGDAGADGDADADAAASLPLPPRVDVLSAYGAINWWREHYRACTRVLLEVVEETAESSTASAEDNVAPLVPPSWPLSDEGEAEEDAASNLPETGAGTAAAVSQADEEEEHAQGRRAGPLSPPSPDTATATAAAAVAAPDEEASEAPSYITVFMNSDEEEDGHASPRGLAHVAAVAPGRDDTAGGSSPPSEAMSATTSVLGLRRIAGSRFSTGTTVTSSTVSSRGTVALYGAITEELRQVALLEHQTETQLGQSRHALRAEFDAQLWRRRRESRLGEWRALRLALRLRRVRAMEGLVEELRDVYMIRAVGHVEPAAPLQQPRSPTAEDGDGAGRGAADALRFVVPLRHLPPPRAAPPVVLYSTPDDEEDASAGGRRGSRAAAAGRSRRTSFAVNPTIVASPPLAAVSARRRSSSALSGVLLPSVLLPSSARRASTISAGAAVPPLLPPGRQQRRSSSVRAPPLASSRDGGGGGGGVSFIDPPSLGAVATVRQLRDVAPAAISALAVGHPRLSGGLVQGGASMPGTHLHADSVTRLTLPSPSPQQQQQQQRRQEMEATMFEEHAHIAAAAADGLVGVQRDELGYAHPDALYRVADINDDEFLLQRTGPRNYARRDAEDAALTQLAAGQAQLAACTVDNPDYVRRVAAAAAAAAAVRVATAAGTRRDDGGGAAHDSAAAHPQRTRRDPPRAQDCAEEDVAAAAAGEAPHRDGDTYLLTTLDPRWQRDDPQRGAQTTAAAAAAAAGVEDVAEAYCHDAGDGLWSWTAADAHRLYLDDLTSPLLHRVLTGPEVDRALLVDVALTGDEAESLQRCSGYYRALGQYTASFLTHKALQLTLLPPYGSLHRLATQFLDVCLLQRPPIAVRLMDAWMVSVDGALRVMAEAEETAMVQAIEGGETRLPALTTLTDTREGLDWAEALASLNTAFQREWATCVTHGEATVKLEWRLTGSGEPAPAPVVLTGGAAECDTHLGEDATAAEDGGGGGPASRVAGPPSPPLGGGSGGGGTAPAQTSAESSPVLSFLSALSLEAAGPWCSGAWLLPDHTLQCTGAIFRMLLFWKSAERVVLHTWRAGMDSGLSSVFFFCTAVRQVLLSSLQEALWMRLAELTAAYRESLKFEAGVLYTYRALESFTVDHAAFLRECEFYTLCGPQFQRRVRPVLRAMLRAVEEAERALRFAQVSIRVARRQYMATFHFMVGGSSESDEEASSASAAERQRRRPPAAAPRHVFTPSRWSRQAAAAARADRGGGSAARHSPWYMQPLQDALERLDESPTTASDGARRKPEVDLEGTRTPRRGTRKAKKRGAPDTTRTPSSVLSSATTARSTTPVPDAAPPVVLGSTGGAGGLRRTDASAASATPRKSHHRGSSQPPGARHPPSGAAATATITAPRDSATAAPAMKRPRRGQRQERRRTAAEQRERRDKLRAIAERKIHEEVDHQRRLMRDMVSRQLRRFALLTQSLRDALAEVMAQEDVRGAQDESAGFALAMEGEGASIKSTEVLHKARRLHMDRHAYLATMLRRLDALIEVMATQV